MMMIIIIIIIIYYYYYFIINNYTHFNYQNEIQYCSAISRILFV